MIFARSTATDPFNGEYGDAIVPLAEELTEVAMRLAHKRGRIGPGKTKMHRNHRGIARDLAKRDLRRLAGRAAPVEVAAPASWAEELVAA